MGTLANMAVMGHTKRLGVGANWYSLQDSAFLIQSSASGSGAQYCSSLDKRAHFMLTDPMTLVLTIMVKNSIGLVPAFELTLRALCHELHVADTCVKIASWSKELLTIAATKILAQEALNWRILGNLHCPIKLEAAAETLAPFEERMLCSWSSSANPC
jgi:hypothetical protein